MSKYMTYQETLFKDRDLLIGALEDIGCKQIHQGKDLEMGRYYLEQSVQNVQIIIPRNSIGNTFGDIGFLQTDTGEYRPVMDNIDHKRALKGEFIPKLRMAYNERVIAAVTAKLRGTAHRTTEG